MDRIVIQEQGNNKVVLEDEDFHKLRDFIKDYTGIFFSEEQKYLIESRLVDRLAFRKLNSFRDYYLFLKYDKAKEEELSAIVDILTTNETYFFRELPQIKALFEEIIPTLKVEKAYSSKPSLKLWSAGSSTGEEPYTIAMLAKEYGVDKDFNLEILASDISQRVLAIARKGIYGQSSFRVIDDYYKKKYFEPYEGRYKIKDEIKNMVKISRINLMDSNLMNLLPRIDAIICRNVLIYFDTESKKKLAERFYEKLFDNGWLLLGHAESLICVTNVFKLVQLKNDLVYRKPAK
ncbi:MAG: protein-glutamate O-methyltransferase CheR [Deltaproteobacteria bacterium]|nr:protein-glutamate O-methyltransferase CheR [Deltaproteobacteria bacterium]MCL5792862.1 protein-glutamate O-methyltransferase CheR [Deltaproteobacteria bacterium]